MPQSARYLASETPLSLLARLKTAVRIVQNYLSIRVYDVMAYAHVRQALVFTTQPETAYIMQPETGALYLFYYITGGFVFGYMLSLRAESIRTCAASTGFYNAAGDSVHNAAGVCRNNAAGFRMNNIA